jgi:glycosyltransferase involved in cell wall biosynthesis
MRRVYIVLSTMGVGGAEKRFTDIWWALRNKGMDVNLVMDSRTHSALAQQKAYASRLSEHPNLHVLDFGGRSYMHFVRAMWKFFRTQPPRAIVHYPLASAPLVQSRFKHRMVVSWVDSSFPKVRVGRLKYALPVWGSFVAADRIDVLNPNNLRVISAFPGMRGKASLTAGGTHIDCELYRPLPKDLDFVFLGRIEPEKQSLRFVQALPEVHRALQAWGFGGYRFVVCGEGSESAAVAEAARSPAFRDLPFSFGFTSEPENVLGRASVFFSLQRTSNYPSKALAEAMAAGAFPVLTDAGESALMMQGCPHYAFVPVDFSAADIAGALRGFLELDFAARERVATTVSEYAGNRFTVGKQAAYFARLYEELSA